MTTSDFEKQIKLANNTFYQVVKDMERLELIEENKEVIRLHIGPYENKEDFNKRLQLHLQERLPNNRLISRLLKRLNTESPLTIDRIAELLAEWSPYMSLTKSTRREYARTFAKLMDAAHLATFKRNEQTLTKYKADTIITENSVPQARHRVGIKMPWALYTTIEKVMEKLYEVTMNKAPFDPELVGLKANTYAKTLTTLEDLEFVVRKNQAIELLPKGTEFVLMPQRRAELLAESALKKIEAFSVFIAILQTHQTKPKPPILAKELKDKLGADWKDNTAKAYVRTLLDWAQHTNLAPHLFSLNQSTTTAFAGNIQATLWS